MRITTILFDLDGTLLPMDQEVFTKSYFKLLTKKLTPHGYDPEKLIEGIWAGTMVMIKNNGERTNEEVFWDKFTALFGEEVRKDIPLFEDFYQNEFQAAKDYCGFQAKAAEVIEEVKRKGIRLALATNPVFPEIATRSRIGWAGLKPDDFEFYTTYETSNYCKPNPAYFQFVLDKMNVKADECLMVGNDVFEDGVAAKLGMSVFLLTDCLINKENLDYSHMPHGNFDDLLDYIRNLD